MIALIATGVVIGAILGFINFLSIILFGKNLFDQSENS